MTDNAETDSATHTITLGPKAFKSDGWLGSTLGHELVHVDQFTLGNVSSSSVGLNDINEIEAYDWEIKNSSRFGLTAQETSDLQTLRSAYIISADPYYITQSLEGNYLVAPWNRQ